jgi:hypothetical protein
VAAPMPRAAPVMRRVGVICKESWTPGGLVSDQNADYSDVGLR